MTRLCSLALAALVILGAAVLGAAGGCGAKTEAEKDAGTAAISGGPTPAATPGDADSSNSAASSSDAANGAAQTSRLASASPPSPDAMHPVVIIQTTLGDIKVVLDRENASMTVDNFLAYVASGHYDGTIFHQVLKDYVIIGGGFTPELVQKPTRSPVYNEARNGQKNVRGAIAMVRPPDQPHWATCQFFINVTDNPNLDHQGETPDKFGYCVFGHVAPESMAVVDRIAAVPVTDRPNFERIPIEPVIINTVKRVQ